MNGHYFVYWEEAIRAANILTIQTGVRRKVYRSYSALDGVVWVVSAK